MKRKLLVLAVIAVVGCQLGLRVTSIRAGSLYVINNVTVIDGTGKPAQAHMTVILSEGRIESIEPIAQNARVPKGAILIDGKGKFLIPGLWDTHLHLVDIGEVAIPVLPACGITSVRDMGGDVPKLKAWRSQIERGMLIGPRIKFCGPMLEGAWNPTSAGGRTDHWVVANPDQARKIVNELADEGVDCIKMRSYASAETYFALAAAARERRLPLVGHAPWGVEPILSSDAGQVSYEHGYYPWPWKDLAPEKKADIENTFRKNGSIIVPTLIGWETFRFPVETSPLLSMTTAVRTTHV